ncbi:hypothetical protein CPB84DRAFT_1753009 [Gymnopilus junonius]|uniref:Uncharacterized protein n=1 Tax=Gymnopilus junonius TaxID=109634 RepID=A0A9P5N8A0_GYMJU|nr:hypothetical protein CPB84DRAFT_1753009 [Gymnopilus junonius]
MDPDAPALNTDGTLKDASEIQWFNSPSDECHTINLKDSDAQKKRKHADSSAHGSDTDSEDGLPRSVLTGLKGKSPAWQVGGKHTRLLSDKAKAATSQLTAKERGFYENLGKGQTHAAEAQENSTQTSTHHSTCQLSPSLSEKHPPAPDPTTPPNKPARASTSKARHNVIMDTDDDTTEDNTEVDEGDEDGEGDESGNEQDTDEDPLQKYLRMRDDIQAERMLANTFIEEKIPAPKTYARCSCQVNLKIRHWTSQRRVISAKDELGYSWEMYLKICQKMGIKPNEHVLPNPEDMPSDTTMQTHLDGFIQATPNIWEEVIEKANLAIWQLKEEFKIVPGKISYI